MWPTYTNIGIDDRNTFDLIRSMPGGVEGIRAVVEQLHDRGVKVLWPYHPWDHSTRGQQRNNVTDFMAMAELLRDTGADGFNGDTMAHIPKAFYDAAVSIYKPIALEAEGGLSNVWDLNYATVGWGEGWNADEPNANADVVDVDKAKWLTDGKAMTNFCDRWIGSPQEPTRPGSRNRQSELQYAWFNGLGAETWENVWGTWNGITPRDGEVIRRVALMLRFFGARGFLQSSDWLPHTSELLQMARGTGMYASAFPSPAGDEVVYAIVNKGTAVSAGPQLKPGTTGAAGRRWYDCYHGVELHPDAGGVLSFEVEAGGFGCVVGTANVTDPAAVAARPDPATLRGSAPVQPATLSELLRTMATLTATPLDTFSAEWKYLDQTMIDAGAQTLPLRPLHNASATEVYVPGDAFHFVASGVELEGKLNSGVDVQYPWETYPHRAHDHQMQIGAMYVDKSPVTNAEYAEYLAASGYAPDDTANWLKHNFDGTGKPRAGWDRRPVTYVSLDDARAYCKFYNKRLPHAYEWQYFAQGTDGRKYPWGSSLDPSRVPRVSNNWTNPGPEPVGVYPTGASPFGVLDLVGSVWQYTSEFQDNHTRAVIPGAGPTTHRIATQSAGGSRTTMEQHAPKHRHALRRCRRSSRAATTRPRARCSRTQWAAATGTFRQRLSSTRTTSTFSCPDRTSAPGPSGSGAWPMRQTAAAPMASCAPASAPRQQR